MKLTKRLNYLVKLTLLGGVLSLPGPVIGQTVDLQTCQDLARELSPLKRQEQYLRSIDALNRGVTQAQLLPSLNLQGRAGYQSDVFSLPFSPPPGGDFPQIPKDQYQLTLNLSQPIYDGGLTKASQKVNEVKHEVKNAQMEVSLYQAEKIINELYFNILTLDENQKILGTLIRELDNQLNRAQSALQNGVLLPSEIKSLKKEKLSARQQLNELKMRKQALVLILSDWTGKEISPESEFVHPEIKEPDYEIDRPELNVFANQINQLQAEESLISAKSRPKLSAFATAGYGSPNPYNFFEVDWNTFYMIGGRLEWNLWNWNRTKKQREILGLNQQIIFSEKENFEKNVRNEIIRQQSEIKLLESSLATDQELINLQKDILQTADSRFAEGVISASDYLSELHAMTQAELQHSLHQIQLAKAKVTLQTLTGDTP